MRYLTAAHTDVGISKKTNQDAFCLEVAKTPKGQIVMAVLCDGMGGLQKGEVASANVVLPFSKWFEQELPAMLGQPLDFNKIKDQWSRMIADRNAAIMAYGNNNSLSLGTTLTVLLLADNRYLTAQIGDSRAYQINNKSIKQITKDQSLVAREVEEGKITKEQAMRDSRRNILLQCIGAMKAVEPVFTGGEVAAEDVFLLCSDGFVHELSENEVHGVLAGTLLTSEAVMKESLVDLVKLNMDRQERDNITALLIKAIQD